MYDPLIQKPGESIAQLNQRETERSNAFYAKFSHDPKDLASSSKVSGVHKPKIRTFKGSRFVEFIVKRWDETSKVYTSADFPHMNPVDLFNILKAYRKHDGAKETIAIRHHKALIREFLMIYCFDYGTIDSVIQATKFQNDRIPPPHPNRSVEDFEDKTTGYKETPEKSLLYRLKNEPEKVYAFRFKEKHLYTDQDLKRFAKKISTMILPDEVKKMLIEEITWYIELRRTLIEMTDFLRK